MKKSKIILTMATMASMLALMGCNAEISLKDMTERETTVAEMLETMVDEQTKLITSGNDTETKELKVLYGDIRRNRAAFLY